MFAFLLSLRYLIPILLIVFGLYFAFKRNPDVKNGTKVMIPDGRHGQVIETVIYDDMTVYGVRVENEIIHFQRSQLVKRKDV